MATRAVRFVVKKKTASIPLKKWKSFAKNPVGKGGLPFQFIRKLRLAITPCTGSAGTDLCSKAGEKT